MKMDLSDIRFSKSDIDKERVLPTKITNDLAEEIGLHVGDGSMNIYSNKGLFQLRGHIKDDKEHYFYRIKELYKELYNLNINIREMKSMGVIGFQVWSDAIVQYKHNILGLPLGKKTDIAIPKQVNNKSLFFSFMKGLFDTDGCLYIENKRGKAYPRIEIRTTSKELCMKIVELMKKYGMKPTYYEYKRKEPNWNNLHTMSLRGFSELDKWFKNIGSNNPKHIKRYNLVVSSGNNGPAETFKPKV